MELNKHDIKVIFFDATGTLFDVRGSVGAIYSNIAGRHGVQAAPEALDTSFRVAFNQKTDDVFPQRGVLGFEEEKAWWRDVVWAVFSGRMAEKTFPAFFEDVFEIFRETATWTLFSDTPEVLDRLRAAGYRLAVISNFDSRLLDVLEGLKIAAHFESVFLSWRIGAAKPDKKIFSHALSEMGVPPSQALHVGDSIEEDLEGALAAGLHAVLLDRNNRHPGWIRSTRLRSLSELVALLRI